MLWVLPRQAQMALNSSPQSWQEKAKNMTTSKNLMHSSDQQGVLGQEMDSLVPRPYTRLGNGGSMLVTTVGENTGT